MGREREASAERGGDEHRGGRGHLGEVGVDAVEALTAYGVQQERRLRPRVELES